MSVDLAAAKAHLRVTGSSEDTIIAAYLAAASAWVERFIGTAFEEFEDGVPVELDQATLLLIGHFYQFRDENAPIPEAVKFLCGPFRTPTLK